MTAKERENGIRKGLRRESENAKAKEHNNEFEKKERVPEQHIQRK